MSRNVLQRPARAPANEFVLFKKPMTTEGLEENLLGVAFAQRHQGVLGPYTPKGVVAPVQQPVPEPSSLSTDPEQAGDHPDAPSAQPPTNASAGAPSPDPSRQFYATDCPWPRQLVKNIYPPKATKATGVEEVRNSITGGGGDVTILGAIAKAFNIGQNDLDVKIIPVVRRWSMMDPQTKIHDLLQNEQYRSHIIDLFMRQKPQRKRKILFVATNLVACRGLKRAHLNQLRAEGKLEAGDPTNTIDVHIGAEMYRVKESSLKGQYQNEIILCMSYRAVRYQRVEANNTSWWKSLFVGDEKPLVLDHKAIKFEDKKTGTKDIFWIDDYEYEGNCPTFLSPPREEGETTASPTEALHGSSNGQANTEKDMLDSGERIFDGASFTTIETDLDASEYPEGFFDEEPSEDEAPTKS